MCEICENKVKISSVFSNYHCNKIIIIPNLHYIRRMYLHDCANLKEISNIDKLYELDIDTCPILEKIPIFKNLHSLEVKYSSKLRDIQTKDKEKIRQYLCIFKITRWYKKTKDNQKRQKILWKIAKYYTTKKYSPDNILKYITLD